MKKTLIKNATVVNEGKSGVLDVEIEGKVISRIGKNLSTNGEIIEAQGKLLIPGLIDDQVHFREPGLTHKADIFTESRAAVAGGITSFMEMPNTNPRALTQELLEDKYRIASQSSIANYSFYMGVSNDNYDEVMKTNPANICGLKAFLGSSTGNMLVDNPETLNKVFSGTSMLIAVHCEKEGIVTANTEEYIRKYGEDIPIECHPLIRSVDACYESSSSAISLAKKHGTRLHILHISTAKETGLFSNELPLRKKKITSEACVHHLWFDDSYYKEKGSYIKWNPAVKSAENRDGIWKAVMDGRIDVIATDHAPHTMEEKSNSYLKCPSGGPLVQHCLPAMMDFVHDGKISIERAVQLMSHNPAILFRVKNRGFIKEGYFADLVLVNPKSNWTVSKENILYKCGWSPFEGHTFTSSVEKTFVNGKEVYSDGKIILSGYGERLNFVLD